MMNRGLYLPLVDALCFSVHIFMLFDFFGSWGYRINRP